MTVATNRKIYKLGIPEVMEAFVERYGKDLSEPHFSVDSLRILEKRYFLKDPDTGNVVEDARGLLVRIAAGVTASPKYAGKLDERLTVMRDYYETMAKLDFLPNSPTIMNAGLKDSQLAACFVLPVDDSINGIYDAVKNVALVHQSGGGTGMDFSKLRPEGDMVRSTVGTASGPVSFMKVFDASTEQVKQGGRRRGASMGMLRVDHPNVMEFIKAKDDMVTLQNFNLSVAVTDKFMRAVEQDEDFDLINPHSGAVVKSVSAREVWHLLVEHAWRSGDPGVVFIDQINKFNPIKGDEHRITATNPCVVGDTKVLTRDGDIPIVELVGKSVDVWNGDEWSTVEPRVTGENQPVLAIDFSNGVRLVCTPYHGFWTKGGKVEAMDLQVGDRLGNTLLPDGTKLGGLSVVAISDAGIAEKVYCFTEPKRNRGTFNGIVTANCGEQPLESYEACNLGSINLDNFIADETGKVDWNRLKETTALCTRFLNDVIDAGDYPLPEIDAKVKSNRKIGLGLMGFADVLIAQELAYGSRPALKLAKQIMKTVTDVSMKESHRLAEVEGNFPNWNVSTWADQDYAMRNATTTTIAPTGTISMLANNSSSGIEPVFALAYVKTVMDGEKFYVVHPGVQKLIDDGEISAADLEAIKQFGRLPENLLADFPYLATAYDVDTRGHVMTQAAFQEFVHNAVSKTVNLPKSATVEDVEEAYRLAYTSGCKGITIYRDGSRDGQVLTGGTNEKKEIKPSEAAQNLTPDASQRRKRPESLDGKTIKIKTGCGSLYVTLSVDEDGNPMEIFCRLGKSGGCASSNMEVYGRLISGWLRAGLSTEVLIRQLRGISCSNPAYVPGGRVLSCADAVGVALERYLAGQFGAVKPVSDDDDVSIVDSQPEDSMAPSFTHIAQKTGGCPECGGVLEYEGGCSSCKACGFSKCA